MKIWLDNSEMDFGTRLRKRIKNSGYTQSDFAEEIGVSKPTLVKYMSGDIDPPLSTFVKMCDVLDTPYNYLLDGNIPFDMVSCSVYGLLKKMGYEVTTNPEDEDKIAIDYHGETILLDYNEIKDKILTFIDFLLYQKTK